MSIAAKFNTTDITTEVSQLRDEANNRIGAREVARSMINQFLPEFPMIVKGEHLVTYVDDRGEERVKSQDKNLSLWLVALQTTLEQGYTSPRALGQTFVNWAKDALEVEWDLDSAVRNATVFIKVMQRNSMVCVEETFREFSTEDGNKITAKVFDLTVACQQAIAGETETMRENSTMLCRPLKNQPEDWTGANEGVGEMANMNLITNRIANGDISEKVLEAVNKLQHVEFKVPDCILDAAEDILDNEIATLSDEDLLMYKEMETMRGRTCFFPVTMDQRGRMYYRGGLITPQGEDFCKAAFQFAKGEALGETGRDAIAIHLANMLGRDKLSITDRLLFAYSQDFTGIQDHYDVIDRYPEAETFQALVAILEWNKMNEWIESQGATAPFFADPAEGFVSTLVCHQDGTCNGLQHTAAITGDRKTAEVVNCTASTEDDVPTDIYGVISEGTAELLPEGEAKDIVLRYGRRLTKKPVMLLSYGAGEDTLRGHIRTYLEDKGENNTGVFTQIEDAIMQSLAINTGGVKTLTEALKRRMAQFLTSGGTIVRWVTEDGFQAATEYRDHEVNRVRAGKFNALVRNMYPAPLDDVKTKGAMAPNFIHSIDAAHLREVVRTCDHELVTVHDSIGSLPSRFFETSQRIRDGFVKVHSYNALENLCQTNGVRTPKFRGDYEAVEALESTYIFS
tara:strand:+ start:349 stop:2394 length:2046 start_codon:yes stop_codon:yes gene_type:complete